jgi:hypothetical protein
LVRTLLAAKTIRKVDGRRLTPDIRFLVSPIPATKVQEVVQRYKHRAHEWIAEWMSPADDQRSGAQVLEEDVTHFIPYRESLASADRVLKDKEVRPRALTASLPDVSNQALEAVQEEFSDELGSLLSRLREIGRTPFSADELDGVSEAVPLSREVGLLSVYEGSEESVERYIVPEIYRHALGMTRKGQF